MFKTSSEIIDRYIATFADGTLRTTQHLYDAEREPLRYLYSETRTGFLQINAADLHHKTIEDYKAIVLDDARWDGFVAAKLDSYFNETLDLSPLGSAEGMTPEYLIRLSMGRIETQFPGGLGSDAGDQDLRDLIAAKGLVLHHNMRHLHTSRRENIARLYRFVIAVAALAVLWIGVTTVYPLHLPGIMGVLISPVVIGLPLSVIAFHLMTILTHRRHRMLGDHFNAATRLSGATVSKCAILRQDTLIFACHHMFEIANTGKEDYWAQGQLKHWTEVNEKWCELIFWINGRVTANAQFAFIRAKLIGMSLGGLQAEARFHSLCLTAGYLASLGILSIIDISALISNAHSLEPFLFLGFSAYMAWQMLRLHGLIATADRPEAVEEILHGDSLQTLKGHKEARLHAEFARFMKREKLKQLYAERTRLNASVAQDLAVM